MARGLTAELVVAAAIELADEAGLSAVTMAAVAKRCGFTTMSLYRHVANKDDLMRRMLDVVLGTPPPFDTSDWRAGLAAWSHGDARRAGAAPVGHRHPDHGQARHARAARLAGPRPRGDGGHRAARGRQGRDRARAQRLRLLVGAAARVDPGGRRRGGRPGLARPVGLPLAGGDADVRDLRRPDDAGGGVRRSGSNSSSTASRPRSSALSCGSGSARSGSGRCGPSSRRRPSR